MNQKNVSLFRANSLEVKLGYQEMFENIIIIIVIILIIMIIIIVIINIIILYDYFLYIIYKVIWVIFIYMSYSYNYCFDSRLNRII